MWDYQKKLQYPVNIRTANPKLAQCIASQYGGPDGELGASIRYLSQRLSMPDERAKACLNDVGTEELGHLEMVGTICRKLMKGISLQEAEKMGIDPYYTDHGFGIYPNSAGGIPFNSIALAVKDDPIADLTEDMAAEEKARATYEKLIDLCADEPDVVDVLRFLREREVVHFQRFGECLRNVQDKLNTKKYYMNNKCGCD